MNDKEILHQIKTDPQKFALVFDSYYPEIFSFSLKRTLDPEVAKDISSEVFLKAFLNIRKFRWRKVPLKIWLYKIAVNEVRGYYKKKKYRPILSLEVWGQATLQQLKDETDEPVLNAQLESLAKHRSLINALQGLPPRQRECVTLFYLDNLTYVEIGSILKVHTGTVKSNVSRGLQNLKQRCNPG